MAKLDTPFTFETADMGRYQPREIDVAAFEYAAAVLRDQLHGATSRSKHMADLFEGGKTMYTRCRLARAVLAEIELPYSNLLADMIDDYTNGDPLDRESREGDDQARITRWVLSDQIMGIEDNSPAMMAHAEMVAVEVERALAAIEFELA